MNFAVDEIPKRLIQGDRTVDNLFTPEENLYIRCFSDYVIGDRILDAGFRFPNFSCNREKHGNPEDVLCPVYLDWGIASYQAKQVPNPILSGNQKTFDVRVEHDPLKYNYPHCEVRAFEEEEKKDNVPRAVRKQFRQAMSEKATVLKMPSISSQEWEGVKEERKKLADEIIERARSKHS